MGAMTAVLIGIAYTAMILVFVMSVGFVLTGIIGFLGNILGRNG